MIGYLVKMSNIDTTYRLAVFSRNYREHLEAARAIGGREPSEPVVLRGNKKWSAAEQELGRVGAMPIYFSPVGSEGQVEYVAELCGILFDPEQGSPEANDWLARAARSTVDEGLWNPPAKMLYAIRGCRNLRHPFPMTALKLRTGKHIDEGFQYSYALVRAIDGPD